MRIILIVQTFIILAGAYYVYTLSQSNEDEGTEVPSTITIEDPVITSGAEEPIATTTVREEPAPAQVGTDVGMEYPIPDGDIMVR